MNYYLNNVWTTNTNNGYYVPPSAIDYSYLKIGTSNIIAKEEIFDLKVIEKPSNSVKLPSYPPRNAYINSNNELVLELALAGYTKDLISVVVNKTNQLTITAKKRTIKDLKNEISMGISHKDFEYTIQFDEIYDLDKTVINFELGLLTITIPRTEKASIKKLM